MNGMHKVWAVVTALYGILIGLMMESIVYAVLFAAAGVGLSLILGKLSAYLKKEYPKDRSISWKIALGYAAYFVILIVAAFILSEGDFSFSNIGGFATTGSGHGSYQGWGAGYNPLTGKMYE